MAKIAGSECTRQSATARALQRGQRQQAHAPAYTARSSGAAGKAVSATPGSQACLAAVYGVLDGAIAAMSASVERNHAAVDGHATAARPGRVSACFEAQSRGVLRTQQATKSSGQNASFKACAFAATAPACRQCHNAPRCSTAGAAILSCIMMFCSFHLRAFGSDFSQPPPVIDGVRGHALASPEQSLVFSAACCSLLPFYTLTSGVRFNTELPAAAARNLRCTGSPSPWLTPLVWRPSRCITADGTVSPLFIFTGDLPTTMSDYHG